MFKLNIHHFFVLLAFVFMAAPAAYFIVGKLKPSWEPPQLEVRQGYQKPDRPVDTSSMLGQYTLLSRSVQRYISHFDKDFRINFPFRSYLLGTYQFQKELLLRADPYPQKVFKGKHNWLFIGNSFNNTVFESTGITQLPVRKLLTIKQKLVGYYNWCQKHQIKFYFMPVPEKQTVFPNYYPIGKTGKLSVMQQLSYALGTNSGFVVNIADTLCRDGRKELYAPSDTHWTGLGAYIAYSTLLNRIKADFPEAKLLKANEIIFDTAFNTQGDLSKMLFRPKTDTLVFLNPALTRTTKLKQKIRPPKTRNQNFIEVYEQRHSSNANGLKAMIYRDSFFVQLATCTNESFGETILLWDFRLDTSAIKNEKPDIVILECAERMLDEL